MSFIKAHGLIDWRSVHKYVQRTDERPWLAFADEVDKRIIGEDRTWVSLQEQLGHIARPQPVRVFSRDRMHIGGLALDGNLPGPRQGRASPLAGLGERPSVLCHLLVGEVTQDGVRQDLFNKIVVLQDHRLAGLRTRRLQGWTHSHLVPVVPALRRHDRLHEGDSLHSLAMAVGPVEAEGRAPVMDDEGNPLAHLQGLEQSVEVAAQRAELRASLDRVAAANTAKAAALN